jgi:pyruvate,orthophosphate dikinase
MTVQYVFCFSSAGAAGDASKKALLGGKGANLAKMAELLLPVPAGFTISTEACLAYFRAGGQFPKSLPDEVEQGLAAIERQMGAKFGDRDRPLLLSCRSGARQSMPGILETVLNLGVCSHTLPGLIEQFDDPWFVYDCYRRLITMYADVVLEKAAGIVPQEGLGIRDRLERILQAELQARHRTTVADLEAATLRHLCDRYQEEVQRVLGRPFPDDAHQQLWGAIGAVFRSWHGARAVEFRRIEGIPDDWGTACNIVAMVFGNLGAKSATGVAFTRNKTTGDPVFQGEWLPRAQGEDVVNGSAHPCPLNAASRNPNDQDLPTLEDFLPQCYRQLCDIREKLERHYRDMLDIEFTIQEGTLWMLQCRVGRRTARAALQICTDMHEEGLIDARTSVTRLSPRQIVELTHPRLNPEALERARLIAIGLPASPAGAAGQLVFTAAEAVAWAKAGRRTILARTETNPEDIAGMWAAAGILTRVGGVTSHAALVAGSWSKCCIVGAKALKIDAVAKTMTVDERVYREGDWISLDGTNGHIYEGELGLIREQEPARLRPFLDLADRYRELGVRANADTPAEAQQARDQGAEGIGLLRLEHVFYGPGAAEPLRLLRKLIVCPTGEQRDKTLHELFYHLKPAVQATLAVMSGWPVTIRLLDPPLHEFAPRELDEQQELAASLGLAGSEFRDRCAALRETNPMMGHRGVRLGITQPQITRMQVRAILEAAAELRRDGVDARPELMVPVTCDPAEIAAVRAWFEHVRRDVENSFAAKITCPLGTMIETPRACLLADKMAAQAEFFSIGSNDLTQMCFAFSRDDSSRFLPAYLEQSILAADPFQTLDQHGVGQLVQMAVRKGRQARPELKVGICGNHGGDPASIACCHQLGLDYVSCLPNQVLPARLAAAQAPLTGREP